MSLRSQQVEFGDFQTPRRLAKQVCENLAERGVAPASILEPTCGLGTLLLESLRVFNAAQQAKGFEVNPKHVDKCRNSLGTEAWRCSVETADFFQVDWQAVLDSLPSSILVIGNPPWVTSATLGEMQSSNLPLKSNFHGLRGLDAKTGKSNFDISEWMLMRLLQLLSGRDATMAMICKTTVARKLLLAVWKSRLEIEHAEIHRIDAASHFGVSVDACLLTCHMLRGSKSSDCQVFESLDAKNPHKSIAFVDDRLVSNSKKYSRLNHLAGKSSYRWRSGIKHDCARVMELSESSTGLVNGLGCKVDIESDFLYPLAKSSDVAKGTPEHLSRLAVVPQKTIGEPTTPLQTLAPKTWAYLTDNAELLDRRASSIYKKRPRFSIFGVGDYTFAPWKIAISGFYKSLAFTVVGPQESKPVVFDDTIYAIACTCEDEAYFLYDLLSSNEAQEFYSSLTFWDSKRPITADLLSTLSLDRVAAELGLESKFLDHRNANPWAEIQVGDRALQKMLFDE